MRHGLLPEQGVVARFRAGGFEGDDVEYAKLDEVVLQTRLE